MGARPNVTWLKMGETTSRERRTPLESLLPDTAGRETGQRSLVSFDKFNFSTKRSHLDKTVPIVK